MILVDTSAVFAFAKADDPDHARAVSLLQTAAAAGETLLIHSYLISEAISVLQRRLGNHAALAFLQDLDHYTIHWMDRNDHDEAAALFRAHNRRGLSLVDCASFVVMRRYGVTRGLFFDVDFEREGFELYAG